VEEILHLGLVHFLHEKKEESEASS
jgi:hypothetical protein